jgi:hypothetical protein
VTAPVPSLFALRITVITLPDPPGKPPKETPSNCNVPAPFEKFGSVIQKFKIEDDLEIDSIKKIDGKFTIPEIAFMGKSLETIIFNVTLSPTLNIPLAGVVNKLAAFTEEKGTLNKNSIKISFEILTILI